MYIYLTPSVRWNRTFVGGAEIRKLQEKTKTTMMRSHKYMDCKTVVFILKISKESAKCGLRVLRARRARKREKKNRLSASLASLALCFQPRSRPFL